MRRALTWSLVIVAAFCTFGGPTRAAVPAPAGDAVETNARSTRRPSGRVCRDPHGFVSEDTLFTHLEALTTIRPYAGWRNSASPGESEAVNYVVSMLEQMPGLEARGLEIERRSFRTYSATEFRETRVEVTIDGAVTEVPAFGISGHRDDLWRAMHFDSDGQLNDSDPDPVTVSGPPVLVRSDDDIASLPEDSLVVVDYALVDRSVLGVENARSRAEQILSRSPRGIVCVTTFTNVNGQSHGTFAGDLPVWSSIDDPLPPILNVRAEDAAVAGIFGWEDVALVDEVRMTWDMDVHSPGTSEYLVARIPGLDSSRAVIISAHIDSSNTPGAIDDGAGVVATLQVAEALQASSCRPAVDVYLVFYGSHERGLYGSSAFVADHQELLDRTLAVLQIDCLSVPVDGITMFLNLETWPYGRFGDDRLTWPDYLAALATDHGVYTNPLGYYGVVSDSSNYIAWDVPNANLIYFNPYDVTEVHYAGHMHDPYDTVGLARSEADTVVNMATVALAAALDTGRDNPRLRVTPAPDRRAVFVASHTESIHMTPTHFIDLGMALAWHGFDVDMVPYGQSVTSADFADAAMVVVLPVHDYPSADGDVDLYDEAFTEPELDALEAYARSGGLLVVTNSANRLKYSNYVYEANEDWRDMNALTSRFGIEFWEGTVDAELVDVIGSHPLVDGLSELAGARDNGVAFSYARGEVLARAGGLSAVLIASADAGEVLVLADLGMLGNNGDTPENLPFWANLALYARSR